MRCAACREDEGGGGQAAQCGGAEAREGGRPIEDPSAWWDACDDWNAGTEDALAVLREAAEMIKAADLTHSELQLGVASADSRLRHLEQEREAAVKAAEFEATMAVMEQEREAGRARIAALVEADHRAQAACASRETMRFECPADTRDRLHADAAREWGSCDERPAPKVFNLMGMSVDHVRALTGEVSQEVTSTEEHGRRAIPMALPVGWRRWLSCAVLFHAQLSAHGALNIHS